MHDQFLNEPMLLDVTQASTLTLHLPDDISDFLITQALDAPLLELIVATANEPQMLTLRFQPFMEVNLGLQVLTAPAVIPQGAITRTFGQGVRLYRRTGTAPQFCSAQLRHGLVISFTHDAGSLSLSLQANSKFELIPLEQDLRTEHEPKALLAAKALLARQYDYGTSSEVLAIYMSEIEQIRSELQALLRAECGPCHATLAKEVLRLEPLLVQKRQWIFRTYTLLCERPNYQQSANDALNTDKLLRKLQCYELLASSELNQMVERLIEDEH